MVLEDRRLKLCKINAAIDISNDSVIYILHEELNTKKLSARQMLHLLSIDQKRILMSESFSENYT